MGGGGNDWEQPVQYGVNAPMEVECSEESTDGVHVI